MLVDSTPKDKNDFEKLILEYPNSSYIWIQFMAYYLKLSEIDQARAVAEKSLQRIDLNLQKEKYNVWVAYMNLENSFGTEKSLNDIFNKALQYSDKKKIYLEAIKMHQKSGKINLAEDLFKNLIKKFKAHKSVWIRFAIFYYKQNKMDEARKLLERSLKSLLKRKHVAMISKFAQLEFKLGTVERGRTIFEELLSTYPKRIDIWNIYLDQEVKNGDTDKIRSLFEKITSLKLTAKKMKYFFKRYLHFEEKFGDSDRVKHVKQRATEFVQSKTK